MEKKTVTLPLKMFTKLKLNFDPAGMKLVAEKWSPKSKKGGHYFVGEELSYSKFV